MKPGRELDALVAEKIMDILVKHDVYNPHKGFIFGYDEHGIAVQLSHYSTEMASAWLVVEKLALEGIRIEINPTDVGYQVSFLRYDPSQEFTPWTSIGNSTVESETAQHAICLSALRVKGINV